MERAFSIGEKGDFSGTAVTWSVKERPLGRPRGVTPTSRIALSSALQLVLSMSFSSTSEANPATDARGCLPV